MATPSTGFKFRRSAEIDKYCDEIVALTVAIKGATCDDVAERFGTTKQQASKMLKRASLRGLIVRCGSSAADSVWFKVGSSVEFMKAWHAAAKARKKQPKERAPTREKFPATFKHVVVPASSRKVPRFIGPRSVFELGGQYAHQ
jgi:hypothetical protein